MLISTIKPINNERLTWRYQVASGQPTVKAIPVTMFAGAHVL